MKILPVLAAALLSITSVQADDAKSLNLSVYSASESSFNVNSTLLYGETEAAVIDAGFSRADALRIAANVLDSNKTLSTIFVSQADPDYYFGVETLKQLFPDVRVIATPEVREVIEKKMATKLKVWAPQMGANAPQQPVLPDAYSESSFTVDGVEVQIKGREGVLAHRPYLWIPAQKAIVGNVGVFGSMHVWTADTQSQEQLDAWLAQLEEMQALAPETVVPGHMAAGTALDAANIVFTADYLEKFIQAKADANNSEELIKTMLQNYAFDEDRISLEIGAKVHMGEMEW